MSTTTNLFFAASLAVSASAQAPIVPTPLQTHALSTSDDQPQMLTRVGGTVYWRARSGTGRRLYRHRGSATTATEVEFSPGTAIDAQSMLAYRNRLYLSRVGRAGLFSVDGSDVVRRVPEGTTMNGEITEMTVAGGLLLFTSRYGGNRRLWISDGNRLRALSSSPANVDDLTVAGGRVYFTASFAGGRALHSATISHYGNVAVKRLSGAGGPRDLTAAGTDLYFGFKFDSNGTYDLCRTDGTGPVGSSLQMVHTDGAPTRLISIGATCYFVAKGGGLGFELREASRGRGVRPVRDINPGSADSHPAGLRVVGDRLFFYAQRRGEGKEPWVYDPASRASRRAREIGQGSRDGVPSLNTTSSTGVVFQQPLFLFQGRAGSDGDREVWVSDGTWRGTRAVTDVHGTWGGFDPLEFLTLPGRVYVVGSPLTSGARRLFFFEDWQLRRFGVGTTFSIGGGCSASGGAVPTLVAHGRPNAGNDLDLEVRDAAGGALVALLGAPARAQAGPVFGSSCGLLLDPATSVWFGFGIASPAGTAGPFRVSDGAPGGAQWFFQAVSLELGRSGATLSRGLGVRWGY